MPVPARRVLGTAAGIEVVECRSCGMRRLEPCPKPEALVRQYAENPFYDANSQEGRGQGKHRYYRRKARRLRRQSPRGRTLFEYGCGTGEFLLEATASGWTACGVDANPRAIERAQSKGAAASLAGKPGTWGIEGPFDVVASFHTLEHVFDLAEVLNTLASLVAPRGLLYLELPYQINSLMDRLKHWTGAHRRPSLMEFHHVNFFTPQALRHWAHREGFSVRRLATVIPFSEHIYFKDSPPQLGRPLSEAIHLVGATLGMGPLIEISLQRD